MRKKLMLISLMAMLSILALSGCKVQPEQISVISQNAGLFSAVGWIAIDNPTQVAISSVMQILSIINEKASDVQAGYTYTATIFPEIVKFIDAEVLPQYRPISKAGSISLLGGIDMLFATNPSWKTNQDIAIKVVESFILGAKMGLSMSEEEEVRKVARNQASYRSRALSLE